jgi:hypothetical protein
MAELVAPDYDGWDDATAVAVSLNGITTLRPVLVAPENIIDYAGTRVSGGVS